MKDLVPLDEFLKREAPDLWDNYVKATKACRDDLDANLGRPATDEEFCAYLKAYDERSG
jgi:hypothetical protein